MIQESGAQIAVVANQIVQARHKLDPRQQKVIAWAIGQIARDDTDFLTHRLSVAEFAHLTGAENDGRIYSQLESVTTSLLRSIVELRLQDGDRSRIKFQWLSECRYRDGEGCVDLRFHERLRPYLLELKSRFTQIRLDRFFRLRSTYSIRFYERLEMQRGLSRQTWTMTLGELREWLSIEPDAYQFFGLFRARVLDQAQRELDAKSDWSFSFQTVKTGRKITGVEFTIRPAKAPKNDPSRDRWRKASPELRAAVIADAQKRPKWEGMTAAEVQATPEFWTYLPDLLAAVEQGQAALPLA